jgi:hypothetical protein
MRIAYNTFNIQNYKSLYRTYFSSYPIPLHIDIWYPMQRKFKQISFKNNSKISVALI